MESKDWVKFSKEIFDLINKVRQNPKCMIATLEKSLERFNGKFLTSADKLTVFETE